jgi:hypothetical protein
VIFEVFVLALASTIRPTSLAAVYTIISHDDRRALMLAYLAAGLAFTIGFGLIVVYAFHGVHVYTGNDVTKGVADIVGGTVALLFGVAIATGRLRRSPDHDAPVLHSRWQARTSGRVTTKTAALAGPVTHIPGLFYLIALNVVAAYDVRVARGTIAVLTYNAVWFALPILALVVCILRPSEATQVVGAVDDWARSHTRAILLVVSFGVGTVLLIRGLIAL